MDMNDVTEYQNATAEYHHFMSLLDEKLAQKTNRASAALDNERLDSFVPDSIDTTKLLVDLEGISNTHHMLFGNVAVDEGDAQVGASNTGVSLGSELATADISFEVVGSYEQFKNFIRDIEHSLTLFEITKISFTSREDGVFGQYAVTVRAYALPAQ